LKPEPDAVKEDSGGIMASVGNGRFWSGFTLGTGTGAGFAALADPDRGRRRRAMVRDRITHAAYSTKSFAHVAAVDTIHRLKGTAARVRGAALKTREKDVPDDILQARVRTALGRLVSHPHAIHTAVRDGRVDLDGYVVGWERKELLRGLCRIPGVRQVVDVNLLDGSPDLTPALQGGRTSPAKPRNAFARTSWRPATRLAAGAGALALVVGGACRRGKLGLLAGSAGALLALRAGCNLEARRLLGLGGRRGIDVRKNLHINAAPEVVYRFCRNIEALPCYMPHVKDVRELDGRRSKWTVAGPAGAPVSWTSVITSDVPGEVLAWESVPGSMVRHLGAIRFKRAGYGTDVEVHLSYNPPGGVLAHAIATAFGADPKHDLDRDLLQMKSLIEHGKTTMNGETIRREDVAEPSGDGHGAM
jgi:uncharacterized membrane protein